jgi:hypothetical protein
MKRIVGWLFVLCLLVACSDPDQGPPLGPFAAITKTETDAPFNIVPPSSKSPAAFTYTSSDQTVATIAGSLVTIHGPGTSTITASQASTGGYGPTSATTTLTVTAVACDNGGVRTNGVCTVTPTCISPAAPDSNNTCVAPAAGASQVTTLSPSLTWMGVSTSHTWDDASLFCPGSTIAGLTGWRQPTEAELKALKDSGLIPANWKLGPTWSSDLSTTLNVPGHVVVDLSTGTSTDRANGAGALVSCVHAPAG